jgi:dihydroorotate dehydrogenase
MPDLYPLVRPLLFALPPELAHGATLAALRLAHRLGLLSALQGAQDSASVTLMGLKFPNRLGIAAGLDKNGTAVDALGALGFGFIEVGTVTPRPQRGNPRPRLFRLKRDGALINRMGFPNEGAIAMRDSLHRRSYLGICGINIGKNAGRPLDEAASVYVSCVETLYEFADYFAVNISSPNTAELRQLQRPDRLQALIDSLLDARLRQQRIHGRFVPMLVKLTADLDADDLILAARIAQQGGIDGLIVSNTTVAREGLRDPKQREEGGLSGAPLLSRALDAVRNTRGEVGASYPVVGVGGIASAADGHAMRAAGADLVQIYTGLIYRGPALVNELRSALDGLDAAIAPDQQHSRGSSGE